MTCIVAIAQAGIVCMGGDSAGVGPGYCLQQRADQKVFRNGDYLFGFTSSFRMGQLLRYRFEPPRRHPDDDLLKFMSTEFVDGVRKILKEHGWTKIEHSVEEGGTFLVAVEGQIFRIEDDFQVGQTTYPYQACGCGEDIALGALHAIHAGHEGEVLVLGQGETLADRLPDYLTEQVGDALEAAEQFSAGVRGPFHILTLPGPAGGAA